MPGNSQPSPQASEDVPLLEAVRQLLGQQKLAVLGTTGQGPPHLSLVGVATSDDLRCMVFATSRSSRKFVQLREQSQVSLLVDNRSQDASDLSLATAVTVSGTAEEVAEGERGTWLTLLLAALPELAQFARAPSTALIRVRVDRLRVVTRFDEVAELSPS